MVGTRRLTELVSGATDRLYLPSGPIVVALSGGADSASLAFLSIESGSDVRALHVDHGLPGSPRMREAANAIATRLDLSLQVVEVQLEPGPSPEDRARMARYEAFAGVDKPILTGHTRDDDAETILLNLIRGTGPTGLAGIPSHRHPNVYRPMLDITRSETREIATLAGLPYTDDPMNEDLALTRNRVRRRLLPEMVAINPDVVMAITRAASLIRDDDQLLDSLTPEPGEGLVVSQVATVPQALGDRLILRWLEIGGVERNAEVVARVRSLVDGQAPRQDLSGGKSAVRRGALVVIE